ncbi:MAG: hypothetical protein ACR2O4_17910 [Hyphomicrobiaceae bacterium]
MIIFRILASWFLIVGIIALVYDGIKSLGNEGDVVITALGKHWFQLHPTSLNGLQAGVERYVAIWLWDPVLIAVLQSPTWIVSFVLALFFYWIGRKRRRTNIYAN